MTEREWVKTIIGRIEKELRFFDNNLRVIDGRKLPYSSEILSYEENEPNKQNFIAYETDILVLQKITKTLWKPRIILETKLSRVTTHDAITYSQKAQNHKNVHPYLRYGILIGNRKHHPLPGRLFRHGQNFDFMLSWKDIIADKDETQILIDILLSEYESSKMLDEIIYNSRSSKRMKFTSLHKPLNLIRNDESDINST